MPTLKLTKTAIESARPEKSDYELRDTAVPGFLCKVTPSGRKVFMLSYRTVGGSRRKPAIGQFGELTVEQARTLAQEWQARVRAGGDPSLDKNRARTNPTIKEFCAQFIEQYSIPHNKPSTVHRNRQNIKNHIVPALGKIKVADLNGRVRQRGVISGVPPGCIDQAALGVICSGVTSSICGVARAAMPSICM